MEYLLNLLICICACKIESIDVLLNVNQMCQCRGYFVKKIKGQRWARFKSGVLLGG